ncbi:hypothetical protein ACX40Y_07765 [Sphingomonas sp. RS6]
MIEPYDWARGREAMIRFGPATGPVVVAALPLFEEANRTRTLVATILRHLADRGIAGVIPDLPGTGDSLIPSERIDMTDLRAAFAAAARTAGKRAYSLAIRSGALLDGSVLVSHRWHFAPQGGAELRRALDRIRDAGTDPDHVVHRLPDAFLDDLPHHEIEPARVVRLIDDERPADLRVNGVPLWALPAPGTHAALAATLAADIADWVDRCEA